MLRALRCNSRQIDFAWEKGQLTVGLFEIGLANCEHTSEYLPWTSLDRRYTVWVAGEFFNYSPISQIDGTANSQSIDFRRCLLEFLLKEGFNAIAKLDGEFQVIVWDELERRLVILNDRFGSLPVYWANTADGFAFAGGVRGVLMAPGVSSEPDLEAIQEAVSFGGFRIGDRTNIAAVKMLPGASVLSVKDGAVAIGRYWSWSDIAPIPTKPTMELVEQLHELWTKAIQRRLVGSERPGQTLSGGLDSRAILAEAAPQSNTWTAITYGVAGCDDQNYASQAAKAVGANWVFHELYSGDASDDRRTWLDIRTDYIHITDGLIDLTDLMHLETLELQAANIDCHLSGYIGDAVSGPTFNEVVDVEGVLSKLPYYGTELGFTRSQALERAEIMLEQLRGASPRFALFEHKLPQSTNRWGNAWRAWFRVRRPFTDYEFFDFCQGLDSQVRGQGNIHEHWLKAKYPKLFSRIPNQKTGMPILSPKWLVTLERGRRFAWKKLQPVLAKMGGDWRPRIRNYNADDQIWRKQPNRQRIEQMILRVGSISCEVLGRRRIKKLLSNYFQHGAAPTQVVGSMYVFEAYHSSLKQMLSTWSKDGLA